MSKYTDIGVEKHGHVGLIEIRKPPLNFFDVSLINQIADALEEFDKDIEIRASVLAAQGKAFCAGANFSDPARQEQEERSKSDPASNLPINHLYVQAVRIFRNKKPIVAAVHGAASVSLSPRIFASPARRRGSPPISQNSAFIRVLG
jgi:enoyl-CoA hydratase/carnithine racemase